MVRYREEVINIRVADILREMGFQAIGETISKGKLPDIILYVSGVKINIEGRFETSSEATHLVNKCEKRVENGICDIAVGIKYPEALREAEDEEEHLQKIKNCELQSFAIYTSSKGREKIDFGKDRISNIAQNLSNLYTTIVNNDILKDKIAKLNKTIQETHEIAIESDLFFSSEEVLKKLRDVLGIKKKKYGKKKKN